MTDSAAPTLLLPPDVESHPPLAFHCPHCAAPMTLNWVNVYAHVHSLRAQWTTATRPRDIYDEITGKGLKLDCPMCQQDMRLQVEPVARFSVTATAPDPLEAYPPNSRYWEAQKRGLPIGGNLTLAPQEPTP